MGIDACGWMSGAPALQLEARDAGLRDRPDDAKPSSGRGGRVLASYVADWEEWLAAGPTTRPWVFGQILRRWQATRPTPIRRTRGQADHEPPFLEDLLDLAADHVRSLGQLTIAQIGSKTPDQTAALMGLWETFEQLTTSGTASCVGISKAVLLVTEGRIGPAVDSSVRSAIKVQLPVDARSWLRVLGHVGADIAMFNDTHGPLREAVPAQFAHLATGRLYDMALGPR